MRPFLTETLGSAVALGLLLSACGSGDSAANAPAGPAVVSVTSSSWVPAGTAASVSESTTAPTVASTSVAHIADGTVIRRSDTSDVSDLPVAQGDVLVVPGHLAPALWAALGFEPDGPSPLSKFAVSIDETALPAGVETVPIGADGTFELPVVDSDLLVCLANTGADAEPGSPFQVNGCAEVSAQRLGEGPLVIDVGIAGVTLRRV